MKLNRKTYPLIDNIISGNWNGWCPQILSLDVDEELTSNGKPDNRDLIMFKKIMKPLWRYLSNVMCQNFFILGPDAAHRGIQRLEELKDNEKMIPRCSGGVMIHHPSFGMHCWVSQDATHWFIGYLSKGGIWLYGDICWGDESASFTSKSINIMEAEFGRFVASSLILRLIKEDIDAWGRVIPPHSALRLEGDMFPTRNEFNRPFTYIN